MTTEDNIGNDIDQDEFLGKDAKIRVHLKDRKSNGLQGSFVCSSRFALIIIGFFGFLNLYALRVDMSVAIVCMTPPGHQDRVNTSELKICRLANGTVSRSNYSNECDDSKILELDDIFDWDKETKGLILGSFFLGYVLTQLPGGWLAGRYGGKRLYGWSMFLCAAATLLTPLAARTSVVLLIVLRALAGLCQGVAIPCMQTLLSYWIPPLQRSTSVGFVYAGTQVGVMVAFPLCGVLCVDGFDGGWPSIFYVLGIILAISNTTGSLGGFFAPVAIGIITVDKTRDQWKTVFYIAAAVYTFGAIFYAIFASGELQPWARDEKNVTEETALESEEMLEIKSSKEKTSDI